MEDTNYLNELLLSYKEMINELKKDKIALQSIIDKLLSNTITQVETDHCNIETFGTIETIDNEVNDIVNDIVNDNVTDEKSYVIDDIFKIADEFNISRSIKGFPSYQYFKSKGINRYILNREKGLKVLREKYFESRKDQD